MTLSVGIKNRNATLLFTDCMATETSARGEKLGTTEVLKLSKICDGIYFSMVGDANSCKEIREICRHLVGSTSNLKSAFEELELFFNKSDLQSFNCEFLIISRHRPSESSLYYFKSGQLGIAEILDGHFIVLGSAKPAVEEKLKNFLSSAIAPQKEMYKFETQLPRLLATYLNQWCIGDKVDEGFLTNFGSRIIYLSQNEQCETLQPTSITVVVFHPLAKIQVRLFTHFWDEYGLILYDSFKHNLNYLIDDNSENLQRIPKGEALFERMRDIYFNYPHRLYQFMFVPDNEHYDFYEYEEFKFKDGEDAFPVQIKERLNMIANHFQKNAEVVFGDF